MFGLVFCLVLSYVAAKPLYDGKSDTLAIGGGFAFDWHVDPCLGLAAQCRTTFDANIFNRAKDDRSVVTRLAPSEACLHYVAKCKPDYHVSPTTFAHQAI